MLFNVANVNVSPLPVLSFFALLVQVFWCEWQFHTTYDGYDL